MNIERSAGTVIFRKKEGKTYYLLLHYPTQAKRGVGNEGPPSLTDSIKDYWDFPKGHIEKMEKPEEAARRETAEETGLTDISFIYGFKETIKYFFKSKGELILKFVTFYLCQTEEEEIKISAEHCGYEWLPYKEALDQLNFQNAKNILKKANDFLQGKSI